MKIDDICEVISKWCKEKGNEVCFLGSFVAFNSKGDVVDDRYLAYGPKKCLLIDLKELKKNIKRDKDKFINW